MTVETASVPPDDQAIPASSAPSPTTPRPPGGATGAPAERPTMRPIPTHDGGYRDTVESILIAFILAFIFRAFVVEAFVIPTGSMAPTLMGAHGRFTCEECGYRFQVNFSSGSDDQNIPTWVPHSKFPKSTCPNCDHVVHDAETEGKPRPEVPILYGDRILVLKYAYLFNQPSRWDVVVFKSPDDPDSGDSDTDPAEPNGPGKSWYTTNFIKRLVGKPNEAVMVLDGDVYVSSNGGTDATDFKVQSKPRHVQDALWRIVNDNDFLPRRGFHEDGNWKHPWRAEGGSGWDLGGELNPKRVFTFTPRAGGGAGGTGGTIVFDTAANGGRAFSDDLAYAQNTGQNNVSDVKLSILYERSAGDGPLRLQLSKRDDTFTAELTPTGTKLFRKRGTPADPDDVGEEVASAPASVRGGPVAIDFMNVDYSITLRVAGKDVLTTPYEPDVAALRDAHGARRQLPRPAVRITAAGHACSVSQVSLWRDVYYTNSPRRGSYQSQGITWGIPESPIVLKEDEYFVLGDNTVISKDARFWDQPIELPGENLEARAGVVPGRFLLGKAFFVYWPAGFRSALTLNRLSAIPNFGEMRLIE